jgi:hypothetical protein
MTMTTKQRRLRCQRQDEDRNATATRRCCHGAGNASIVTLHLRCQRCDEDVNASAFDDACIAGAVPTTATLRQTLRRRNNACIAGATNNGDATGALALPVPQGWRRSNDDATLRRMTPCGNSGGEEGGCEGGGQGAKDRLSSSSLSSTAMAAVGGPGRRRGCSCRGKRGARCPGGG